MAEDLEVGNSTGRLAVAPGGRKNIAPKWGNNLLERGWDDALMAPMPTINSVLDRLLPEGSNFGSLDRKQYPIWPPDAFAVAATLVNLAGLYCDSRYASGSEEYLFSERTVKRIYNTGRRWGYFREANNLKEDISRIPLLKQLWRTILAHGDEYVHRLPRRCRDATIMLMAIADHACEGVGYFDTRNVRPLAGKLFEDHRRSWLGEPARQFPKLPVSLCRMVPKEEACVQPKSMNARLGCTLRSLSHHLSLLPPCTDVETAWSLGENADDIRDTRQPMNLLLVPFPYTIEGTCFVPGECCFGDKDFLGRFFSMKQNWLMNGKRRISARLVGAFLVDLIREARREVGQVHGVILPELALNSRLSRDVAQALARSDSNLEVFICGAASTRDGIANNCTSTFLFKKNASGRRVIYTYWDQSKHHRWLLEKDQIKRYSIGAQLSPQTSWWELTNIGNRTCRFCVIRGGISFTTLICEDLARIDPVQSVIRSIGPNLVVALLMDGPQLEQRWSGRYATVLADDPGSAVLTLTSLGLMQRSSRPGVPKSRQIALWKGSDGGTEELQLMPGDHALLVTLTNREEECHTMDGRSDGGTTYRLSLSGVHPIRHRNPPKWVAAP